VPSVIFPSSGEFFDSGRTARQRRFGLIPQECAVDRLFARRPRRFRFNFYASHPRRSEKFRWQVEGNGEECGNRADQPYRGQQSIGLLEAAPALK
jgi:hypothetical protein